MRKRKKIRFVLVRHLQVFVISGSASFGAVRIISVTRFSFERSVNLSDNGSYIFDEENVKQLALNNYIVIIYKQFYN